MNCPGKRFNPALGRLVCEVGHIGAYNHTPGEGGSCICKTCGEVVYFCRIGNCSLGDGHPRRVVKSTVSISPGMDWQCSR